MKPLGLILILATTLFPAYQLAILPNVTDQGALFSQYLGLSALILMAWGQVMATRTRGVEFMFGGLDRVYVLHKWAGVSAMSAILLHDTIDADMRNLGRETLLTNIAETLGEISLYGLLILVVLSVATFIPYQLWKWTHKAMGGLFAAATFHFFFILKPFSMGDTAGLYTGVFCLAGLLAYAWTLLPTPWLRGRSYTVSDLESTGGSLAITMMPNGAGLRPDPGQFGIFQFVGAGDGEPHPFSFSKIGPDGSLRVTVKALGNFTSSLSSKIGLGQKVILQGPFGRFCPFGKMPEVWIAGGIGITPFLAWADALKDGAGAVNLFYCVRSSNEAPHLPEIERLAREKSNLNLHVIQSTEGGRLSADRIAATVQKELGLCKFAYCGPVTLRRALQAGLRQHGVSRRQFHYEEFEFRTGIGLGQLASWVASAAQRRL